MADQNNMKFKIKVEGEDDGADNECYVQYWYNSESDCNVKQEIKVEIETSSELFNNVHIADIPIKNEEVDKADVKVPIEFADDCRIKSEELLISDVKFSTELADGGDEIAVPLESKEANISDCQSFENAAACSSNVPGKATLAEHVTSPCHVVLERIDCKTEAGPAPDFSLEDEIKMELEKDVDDVQFVDWRIKSEEVDLSDVEFPADTADSEHETEPAQDIEKPIDSSSKPFQCAACSSSFRNKKSLTRHVSKRCFKGVFPLCVIKQQFKCELCQKLCSSQYQFKTHKMLHSGIKPFKCEVCNRGFMDKSNMKKHAVVHTGEKPFACNICQQRYADKSSFNTHMRWHSGIKPHACKLCDKKFFTSTDLKAHVRSHTGEKPISCKICAQRFTGKGSLSMHMLLHGSETPFECKFCDKKFKAKPYLRRHEKLHSEVEKTAACEICKKVYVKRNLSTHMRMHTGVNLHACEKCGKKFPTKGQLETHEWTHAKVKPFACHMCPDRFAEKQRLKAHINWHLGLKSYECPHCDMKYETGRQLRVHINKMHKVEKLRARYASYLTDTHVMATETETGGR